MAEPPQDSESGDTTGDSSEPLGRVFVFEDFELRAGSCELLRSGSATDLQLKPTRLLLYLVENRDRVVPKTELLDEIWPDAKVSESAFTTAIGQIRHALGDHGDTQRLIRTRRGRGYQFVTEVEERWGAEASRGERKAPVPVDRAPVLREPPRARAKRFGLRPAQAAGVAILLAALTIIWWYARGPNGSVRALAFEERDWVLVAAFDNRAGEALFDGTLEAALVRELSNSRFVNVVPRERIQDALRLMKKPLDTRVDGEVGREICLHDGGIRVLLTTRVDKLGSAYLLSVELVDPMEGVTVASLSETAEGEEQVLSALHRLATSARETLGEEIQQIRVSDEKFETVSTTSLRALQLYTQADAVISIGKRNNQIAEVLLKQAIAEDPKFASAYTLLAQSLRNQLRPQEEFIPYARKALELSKQLPERERYFIEGSYFSFLGQDDQAILSYEALLQLYPDHYRANSNIVFMLQRGGRVEEAIRYLVRGAELRPHDFLANWTVGWAVFLAGDPTQAALLYAKAVELLPALSDPQPTTWHADAAAWALLYPTQDLWIRGDLDRLVGELERWEKKLPSMHSDLREAVAFELFLGYWSIGQTRTDLGVRYASDEWHRLLYALAIANAQDDWTLLRDTLQEGSTVKRWCGPDADLCTPLALSLVQMLAQVGLLAEAREALAQLEASVGGFYWDNAFLVLRGELALAEGNAEAAISFLEAGLPLERTPGSWLHLPGSISLSRALLEKEEPTRALHVLEETSELKSRSYQNRWQWMNTQLILAERYRELGYKAEAREIENELLGLLAYADPDFPLLLRLRGVRNSTTHDSG